jgi:hypothetical protein
VAASSTSSAPIVPWRAALIATAPVRAACRAGRSC